MRTRKMFNLLMLVALALGMVAMPVAADPEAPLITEFEMYVEPGNAQAGAHYAFIFRLGTAWPYKGEAYVRFPEAMFDPNGDDDYADRLVPDLTYGAADPNLGKMLITWAATKAALYNPADLSQVPVDPTVTVGSGAPEGSWSWTGSASVPEGEIWMAFPDPAIAFQGTLPPAAPSFQDYIRIDFWGPANINPGEMDAGIVNPNEEGNYTFCVGTDEEPIPGAEATQCVDYYIGPPLAVRLWRKYQVPLANCGYTRFEYVRGFETIEEAVWAADEVWINEGDYVDEPAWNLFDGCPNFDDVCDPTTGTDVDCDFVEAIGNTGVAVGAVIEVEQGIYTNTNPLPLTDWSTGMRNPGTVGLLDGGLYMDTPGVIMGSVDGPDVTHIVSVGADWDVIEIAAGGVAVGESEFNKEGAGPEMLYGFDISGGDTGVYAHVGSAKCDAAEVYSSTVEAWDVLSGTTVAGWDIEFDCVENSDICDALDAATLWPVKLVNLTNGWSAHIVDGAWYPITDTATLDITADERFEDGHNVAIFYASDAYDCADARIDVRGNVIHENANDGIGVYSASVWIDSNDVFSNTNNGFYGEDLRPCDTVAVCDGAGEARAESELLELSNNMFHENGTAVPGILEEDCFDTAAVVAPDAGINIHNTVMCTGYLTEADFLYIHDNNVFGNVDAGIYLGEGAAEAGNRILWNDITNNGLYGLFNDAVTVDRNGADFYEPAGVAEVDVIFRYNDVTENLWGVYNAAWDPTTVSVYFNAKENFWNACVENGGDDGPLADCPPGGPSRGPAPCRHEYDRRYPEEDMRPLGYGDAVDKGTFYNPWIAVPAYDFETGEKTFLDNLNYQHQRIYGSDSLQLQAGWNTLAVPLPLNTMYRTLGEMRTLGTFLEYEDGTKNYEVAYEYDNVNGDWKSLTGPLQPVHGYLIKMEIPTRFPILYGEELWEFPSYSLTADDPANANVNGWNFIGSAFGIDRMDNNSLLADQGRWAVADPDDSFNSPTFA